MCHKQFLQADSQEVPGDMPAARDGRAHNDNISP